MKAVVILLVGMLTTIANAHAGPIIVDNEADFLSLAGDVLREGFESFPTDRCTGGGSAPATMISTTIFSVTTDPQDGGTSFLCVGVARGGPHPTEGVNALIAGSPTGDRWTLTFNLDSTYNAVAFDLTDAAEGGDVFIEFGFGDRLQIASCCLPSGNELFFGVITNDLFSMFSLINTGNFDGWGIDNMIFATPVPEPSTALLFATGLAGLGFMGWRRRRSVRVRAA